MAKPLDRFAPLSYPERMFYEQLRTARHVSWVIVTLGLAICAFGAYLVLDFGGHGTRGYTVSASTIIFFGAIVISQALTLVGARRYLRRYGVPPFAPSPPGDATAAADPPALHSR